MSVDAPVSVSSISIPSLYGVDRVYVLNQGSRYCCRLWCGEVNMNNFVLPHAKSHNSSLLIT